MEEKAECEQDKWEEEMKQFVKEEVGEQPQTSDSEQQVKAAAGDESDKTVTPSLRHWLLNKKPSLQPENFRETVLHVTEALLEDHGGPVQYLTKVLGTEPGESWDMFARDLDSHFPRRPDLSYHNSLVLPNDNTEVFNLSLYQLGWVKDCSSKPATFKITARRLIDEYLCGSFVTEGDPILLFQSHTTWYEVDDGRGPVFRPLPERSSPCYEHLVSRACADLPPASRCCLIASRATSQSPNRVCQEGHCSH